MVRVWTSLYAAATVAAFASQAYRYANNEDARSLFGMSVAISRGAAQCLNLNCALILLPINHSLTTRLLGTKWARKYSRWVPSDAEAMAGSHKWIGLAIFFWTVVHVGAHMCNLYRLSYADKEAILLMLGDRLLGNNIPEEPWQRCKMVLLRHRVGVTGIIMTLCLIVAYPLISYRRHHFRLFWTSHHLLVIMLIALCLHGTGNVVEPHQSIYWISIPLALYIIPRISRERTNKNTHVLDAQITKGDSDVLCLKLSKPPHWEESALHQQPGMYVFLQVSSIRKYEWHPFTLTSSPKDPFLELHIQKAGDWTTRLHELVQQDDLKLCNSAVIKVDGPFARSHLPGYLREDYSNARVVMLIGGGIGVTPMMSIVKGLADITSPSEKEGKTPERVFLYWTLRDDPTSQGLKWFGKSLRDVAYNDSIRRILRARYFLTGAYSAHGGPSTNGGHELHFGRPQWRSELKRVRQEAIQLGQKECKVFVCGPEGMVKAVEGEIQAFISSASSSDKGDNTFQFHLSKEAFF